MRTAALPLLLALPPLLIGALAGCDKSTSDSKAAPTANNKSQGQAPEASGTTGPHFTKFPGEQTVAAEFVKNTLAENPDRRVLVYVGAEWCEPCQRFHDAVEAGELNETFPDLELVEFDLDQHKPALTEAGYGSRLVPLFSVPNDQGEDQDLRMEGSIKGEAAVQDNLVPRLENLLARSKK